MGCQSITRLPPSISLVFPNNSLVSIYTPGGWGGGGGGEALWECEVSCPRTQHIDLARSPRVSQGVVLHKCHIWTSPPRGNLQYLCFSQIIINHNLGNFSFFRISKLLLEIRNAHAFPLWHSICVKSTRNTWYRAKYLYQNQRYVECTLNYYIRTCSGR